MPQQFRDALYASVARGRILSASVNASYGRNPPHYPGTHLNAAILFNELFTGQRLGRTPYNYETIRSSRLIGNAVFSKQIISDLVFPNSPSQSWVGSNSPGLANTSADCAILASIVSWPSSTRKSRLGDQNYTSLLTGLHLPLMEYRHTQLHRVGLNEANVSHPSIGVAVGQGFYESGPSGLSAPQNVMLHTISDLVLPYTLTDALNFSGWAVVRLPSVVSLVAKAANGIVSVIDQVFTFGLPFVVSAIAVDPRTGAEWLTAANIAISDTDAFYSHRRVSLSRDIVRYPLSSDTGPDPLFSYLSCSLLSAQVEHPTSGSYNVIDGSPIYQIHLARRGASVGGNTAMPLDYDTWDFAAVCNREFYSLAVPAQSSVADAPASHRTFESPEFFRLYEPSPANIGSPMSLLPQREATTPAVEKPYYHQIDGSLVPDLRSADFSLVMLKGMSLIYQNGPLASDASSLVPILPSQSAFRFKSHDITGTTVRFDPVAWTNGTSFGASVPQPDPAVQLPDTQWEQQFVSSFQNPPPPVASVDYWVNGVGPGGTSGIVTPFFTALPFRSNGFSFLRVSDGGLVAGAAVRKLNYEVWLPPSGFADNPFWLSQYRAAQEFTAFSGWDESSYTAGSYAQDFLNQQCFGTSVNPLFLRFPVATTGPQDSLVAGERGWSVPQPVLSPELVSPAIVMPLICGMDYDCGRQDIAGHEPAAGLFSYVGPGPSATVTVPVYARGAKATSVMQEQPHTTFSVFGATYYTYYSDVSFEPYDVSGEITVAMNTPEVTLFVRWHASLQGLGDYKPGGLGTHFTNGIDIDDQRGSVSPFHWVRTSRIGELSPVLIAELWMTARSTADVSVEWQWPEDLPELQSSFPARAGYGTDSNRSTADVSEFNVFAGGVYGTFNWPTNVPVPVARHESQGAFLHDKSPFLAGVFVFNREQTSRLLNGESVYPTRWMEYDEGDPAGDEPQLLRWHQARPATVRPSFTLQFA